MRAKVYREYRKYRECVSSLRPSCSARSFSNARLIFSFCLCASLSPLRNGTVSLRRSPRPFAHTARNKPFALATQKTKKTKSNKKQKKKNQNAKIKKQEMTKIVAANVAHHRLFVCPSSVCLICIFSLRLFDFAIVFWYLRTHRPESLGAIPTAEKRHIFCAPLRLFVLPSHLTKSSNRHFSTHSSINRKRSGEWISVFTNAKR